MNSVFILRPKEDANCPSSRWLLNCDRLRFDELVPRVRYTGHGIDVTDAFLVATAMRAGGKIHTLNRKHHPMPDVLAEQAE